LDVLALVRHGRRFASLDDAARASLVWSLHGGDDPVRRALFMALTHPVKTSYFDDLSVYRALRCVLEHPPGAQPPPRWMRRVTRAGDAARAETLECDVVVVGTGAGGAVVAKELAERGVAVILVEEGEYRTRKDFTKRSISATQMLYRDGGVTGVIGNC